LSLADVPGDAGNYLPADLQLQILTTEHWSLLSTRALSWNEAFSRGTMFLSALSGAVVALALVAQVDSFGDSFGVFALLILPVVLFLGITTFIRLVQINREDVRWVIGMNLLRHAYLDAAPHLRPYFISGSTDDEAGVMTTFGATAGSGAFAHQFVTTPGMLAVVNGALAGIVATILVHRIGAGTEVGLIVGVAAAAVTVGVLALHQYGRVVKPRARHRARFPGD